MGSEEVEANEGGSVLGFVEEREEGKKMNKAGFFFFFSPLFFREGRCKGFGF